MATDVSCSGRSSVLCERAKATAPQVITARMVSPAITAATAIRMTAVLDRPPLPPPPAPPAPAAGAEPSVAAAPVPVQAMVWFMSLFSI